MLDLSMHRIRWWRRRTGRARMRREMLLVLVMLVELGILLVKVLLEVRLLVIVLELIIELRHESAIGMIYSNGAS